MNGNFSVTFTGKTTNVIPLLRNKQKHSNLNTLVEQDRGGPEESSMNRTELKEQILQSLRKDTSRIASTTAKPRVLR